MFRNDRIAAAIALVGYAGLLLFGTGGAADAQTKAKGKAQTRPAAVKPTAPKNTGPVLLGTTQLPGDFGKFGQTYTMGKSDPVNFTLVSARYSVDRFNVQNNTWTPKADEKLLILRFTVHNPNPREQGFYWASLNFTAVDAQDTNREYIQAVVRAGKYDEALNVRLKPAQKIECEAAIIVPADGPTPKLIVQRERGAPVVRYDMRGKVEGVPAPFADPADASGATARAEADVRSGQFYPLAAFDVKLDSTASTTAAIHNRPLKAGDRYYTATFTIKNATQRKQSYVWSHFVAELRDADGEEVPYQQGILKGSRDEAASGELEPGEETRIRFYFPLPEKVAAKTLTLKDHAWTGGKGRTLKFDLASAAAQGE